jgi:hypothetical protein
MDLDDTFDTLYPHFTFCHVLILPIWEGTIHVANGGRELMEVNVAGQFLAAGVPDWP